MAGNGVVVIPVVVLGIVEEGRGGYLRPSGLHRHCPQTTSGWLWPSRSSSAARDWAAIVGRLGFWLG